MMNAGKSLSVIFYAVLALTSQAAFASEGEGGGPNFWFYFKVANFAVFAFILWKVAKKQLPTFLNNRQAQIAKRLEEASAKEQQVMALLKEYDEKLSGLGEELSRMLNKAREEAKSDKERLLKEAELEAKQIIEGAHRSAKRMEAQLYDAARKHLVSQALEKVESELVSQFSEDATAGGKRQEQLVRAFVEGADHVG